MPSTVTATLFKKFKSIARAAAATHSPASAEVITVAHRLGVTPDFCFAILRSAVAYGGNGAATAVLQNPALSFRSANASQALFDGTGSGGATGWAAGSPTLGQFDLVCEKLHSIEQ